MDGATVELVDPETGRKYDLKTNAKGEYSSIGIALGTYDVSLLKDGKILDKVSKVPVIPGEEAKVVNSISAQQAAGMSEEQKKKVEEVQKHNEKVKTLNASLAQAKQLEAAGNYDEAITVLQQATQVDPTQDLVWFSLGDAQRGAKKYPEAIESYQKAIAIKSTVGAYHNNLADAYAKSGQTEKAVQEYTAAAQAEPANAATYYFNEGAVFTNTGKTEEAVVAFDKAIQADPDESRGLLLERRQYAGQSHHQGRQDGGAGRHRASLQQVSGIGAYRPVRRCCQTNAWHDWCSGGDHLRQGQDGTTSQEEAVIRTECERGRPCAALSCFLAPPRGLQRSC